MIKGIEPSKNMERLTPNPYQDFQNYHHNPAAGSPTATLLRLQTCYQSEIRLAFHRLSVEILRIFWQSVNRDKTSSPIDSEFVTGGEYKAQVHIHRGVLIHDY